MELVYNLVFTIGEELRSRESENRVLRRMFGRKRGGEEGRLEKTA